MGSNRALLLVLDGVGVGEAPDAARYGDAGSDTLGNTALVCGGLRLPELEKLGLGNIHPISGVAPARSPRAAWGRSLTASPGKDSTTGHWEMMGVILDSPFPTFPQGFPDGFLGEFSRRCHRGVLGNVTASGTEIIERLGAAHAATGDLIVYTSADSVFQIAAHLDVVPLEELYRCCLIARELLTGPELGVSRVIARPFTGSPGSFSRTARRRDFSLPPPRPTLLDHLAEAGIPATGVGKVDDLFAGRSIRTMHVESNTEGIATLLEQMDSRHEGFIFTNLGDFDTRWGHRNDPHGFKAGLEEVDRAIPEIIRRLRPGELFIVTADHGNDPTTESTDHSREYVPLLAMTKGFTGAPLGVRKTLADIAATLADFFGLPPRYPGTGFLPETRRRHEH